MSDVSERPETDRDGGEEGPWHASEDFWSAMGRVVFPREVRRQAPTEVDGLETLAGFEGDERILDVACGQGRHAIELADRGYRVTGFDRTEAYLETARSRAEDRGVDVEWVREDMREFRRPEAYDAAICLYTSFGFFDDPADNAAVLDHVYASLSPDGTAVFEVVGKAFIAANFNERTWREFDDGTLFLARREVVGAYEGLRNRWVLVLPDGRRESFEMQHRLYSAVELADRLESAGFNRPSIYGGFDGRDYDESSRHLVAVADK